MNYLILKVVSDPPNNIPEISVLTPASVLDSLLNDSAELILKNIDNIPKKIRD